MSARDGRATADAIVREFDAVIAERDKAREECGYEKRMRAAQRKELSNFVRLKVRAEAERDAMHADLRDLLIALGMGDHARPQSPHEVMQEAIERVRLLTSGRCNACLDDAP